MSQALPGSVARHSIRLRGVLGVEAPVIQSGMATVAGPELCAAVSRAGGLGVLASLGQPPDQVRAGIERLRTLTDRPFGVNIWLHDDVRRSPDPATLADDGVRSVQQVFNEMRPRFDLPPRLSPPHALPDLVDDALEVMISERIPVFCSGLGVPEPELVERFHRVGTRVVTMVADVRDALAAADAGVDVVVAQGAEAGGHRSFGQKRSAADVADGSVFSLVPAVIDAVGSRVPVVASGGVVDGRTFAAVLALGAEGALLGSRFVATAESMAAPEWKRAMLDGGGVTVQTDGFTGQWARVLRSEFTDAWRDGGADALPGLLQRVVGADLFAAAKEEHDDQFQPLYAGANWYRLRGLPPAEEVVASLVADADEILGG